MGKSPGLLATLSSVFRPHLTRIDSGFSVRAYCARAQIAVDDGRNKFIENVGAFPFYKVYAVNRVTLDVRVALDVLAALQPRGRRTFHGGCA